MEKISISSSSRKVQSQNISRRQRLCSQVLYLNRHLMSFIMKEKYGVMTFEKGGTRKDTIVSLCQTSEMNTSRYMSKRHHMYAHATKGGKKRAVKGGIGTARKLVFHDGVVCFHTVRQSDTDLFKRWQSAHSSFATTKRWWWGYEWFVNVLASGGGKIGRRGSWRAPIMSWIDDDRDDDDNGAAVILLLCTWWWWFIMDGPRRRGWRWWRGGAVMDTVDGTADIDTIEDDTRSCIPSCSLMRCWDVKNRFSVRLRARKCSFACIVARRALVWGGNCPFSWLWGRWLASQGVVYKFITLYIYIYICTYAGKN
jgi:hypothetical protein